MKSRIASWPAYAVTVVQVSAIIFVKSVSLSNVAAVSATDVSKLVPGIEPHSSIFNARYLIRRKY